MLLLQGQSDPLMLGRRRVNLKCQSSMDISGVRTIYIYEVIGWFKIGFMMLPFLEEEVLVGSGAIVLSELVLVSRASTVSVCSSLVSISASGVAAVSC